MPLWQDILIARRAHAGGVWTPPAGCVLQLEAAISGAVPAEGTWEDFSGSGYDATLSTCISVTSDGLTGRSSWPGGNATMGAAPLLNPGTGDFTACCWFRSASLQQPILMSKQKLSPPYVGWTMKVSSGAVHAEVNPPNLKPTGGASVIDGTWHHLALVIEQAVSARVYRDGVLSGSVAMGSVFDLTTDAPAMLYARDGKGTAYAVSMDGVYAFSAAHTPATLADIMANTGPNYGA